MFAALAIALIALAVGAAAWFRPTPRNNQPSPKPAYTEQEAADAKASVCAAYQKVNHALGVANTRNGGTDPTAGLAVATSTRQVLDAGSRYLLSKLADQNATPPDLADAVRTLAAEYQELTIDYLADVSDSDMQSSFHAADQAKAKIEKICT
jgi:hypothetical protein